MQINARARVLPLIVGAVVLGVLLFCASPLPGYCLKLAPYSSQIQILGPTAAHFPSTIPADATNFRKVFQPGFLQGPYHLEVRFTLPLSSAKALLDGMPSDKAFGPGTRAVVHTTGIELLKEPNSKVSPYLPELTGRYRVFILEDSGSDNHPHIGGVLIDPDTGDVVYFAEM